MARKVLISFLGTNNYTNCNYFLEGFENNRISNVKYIQEAIIKLFCNDFSESDHLYFFVTKEANEKNWRDNGHVDRNSSRIENKGLESCLKNLNIRSEYTKIEIDEGFTTDQIWKIFNAVFIQIQNEDEVNLDITHAFRSLPMLGIALLNYSKTLKNIQVKAIHYGAFEKLGPQWQVEKLPIEERNAPILNLKSFSELQEWTKAAEIFIKYGNSNALSLLAKKEISPLLKEQNDQTPIAREFNKLAKSLDCLTDSLNTNRGLEIVNGNIFKNLNQNISKLSNDNFIVPMKPILEKILEKTSTFNSNQDWKNGFKAVKWCIDHNLVQQGITMLQESLFTYFCFTHKLDFTNEKDREIIKACFWIKNQKVENDTCKWNEIAKNNESKVKEILETLNKDLASDYESLTDGARNDINHGGFTKNEKPTELKVKLEDSFKNIKRLLEF